MVCLLLPVGCIPVFQLRQKPVHARQTFAVVGAVKFLRLRLFVLVLRQLLGGELAQQFVHVIASGRMPTQEGTVNQLRQDLALVRVTVAEAAGGSYRETRFYHSDPNSGWLRTSPVATFWGSHRTVETAYFRIHFRQKDARIVEETAVRLDTIYTHLRVDVGLPPAGERLTIEVSPVPLYQLGYLKFTENWLVVPSPLLLQVPSELSDDVILTQSIVSPLVDHVLSEAQQQAATRPAWNLMVSGLQLWQAYASSGPLAYSIRDTVLWLSAELRGRQSGLPFVSDEDPYHVCHEHQIWRHSLPNSLYLPWLCTKRNPDRDRHLYLASKGRPIPTQLDNLGYLDGEVDVSPTFFDDTIVAAVHFEHAARRLAAATVIDYVVDTYGRQRLPDLVVGFRTHSTWDSMIPAVFGISAQEFESGWQAHLATHSRIRPSHSTPPATSGNAADENTVETIRIHSELRK